MEASQQEGTDVVMTQSSGMDFPNTESGASGEAATDVEMKSTATESTAADSMRAALAGDGAGAAAESVPRKGSQTKNPDEQLVGISGQVQKSHESEEDTEPPKTFKGLQNQGATCYMNSLLQALYMTPDFRQMIYKFK